MSQFDRVRAIVAPSLEAMGYEIVRVQMAGKDRPQLQIMAERADRRAMTVDDCAEISRAVSALLDVEDPIKGPYTLEVSSPGIDRPLTAPGDYERFKGHEAKVDLLIALDGRKRFRGIIKGLAGDAVLLETEGGADVALPYADIARAKLVLTDALIAATGEEARAAALAAAAASAPAVPSEPNTAS